MKAFEIAEQIARDASCAQGEFGSRVLSIIPYLTEHTDEIERLTAALIKMRDRDDRNGSLPKAYRKIIDDALADEQGSCSHKGVDHKEDGH